MGHAASPYAILPFRPSQWSPQPCPCANGPRLVIGPTGCREPPPSLGGCWRGCLNVHWAPRMANEVLQHVGERFLVRGVPCATPIYCRLANTTVLELPSSTIRLLLTRIPVTGCTMSNPSICSVSRESHTLPVGHWSRRSSFVSVTLAAW